MALTSDVTSGNSIVASWGNEIRNRSVQPFTNAAERSSQWLAPPEGSLSYLRDTDITEAYNGSAWVAIGQLPLVSTLPTSPIDGQECLYQSAGKMATDGIVWRFKYRAASSGYKWEFIGGSPTGTSGEASGNVTSSTRTAFGNACLCPLAGDYWVAFGGLLSRATPAEWLYIYLDVSDQTKTTDAIQWLRNATASNEQGLTLASSSRVLAVAAGGNWRLRIANSNGASGVSAQFAWFTMTPIRVSSNQPPP